jgi:hypothetical protein
LGSDFHPIASYRLCTRSARIKKSEQIVPIFDSHHYFDIYEERFPFFTSCPGMLFFRASCFVSRMCLRIPLDGRFVLVLPGFVSNCITPLGIAFVFRFVLCPEFGNFIPGFLAGVPVFDLKQVDEFIELGVRLVHFEQVIFNHQTPPPRGLTSDLLPFVLENIFIQCDSPLSADASTHRLGGGAFW